MYRLKPALVWLLAHGNGYARTKNPLLLWPLNPSSVSELGKCSEKSTNNDVCYAGSYEPYVQRSYHKIYIVQ